MYEGAIHHLMFCIDDNFSIPHTEIEKDSPAGFTLQRPGSTGGRGTFTLDKCCDPWVDAKILPTPQLPSQAQPILSGLLTQLNTVLDIIQGALSLKKRLAWRKSGLSLFQVRPETVFWDGHTTPCSSVRRAKPRRPIVGVLSRSRCDATLCWTLYHGASFGRVQGEKAPGI